jgi:hypothetical protein
MNEQWVSGVDVLEEGSGGDVGGAAAGGLDMAPLPSLSLEEATRRAVHAKVLAITGSDDDYIQEKDFLELVKSAVSPRIVDAMAVIDAPADNTRIDRAVRDGIKAKWIIGVRRQR